jgi:hypothetical protein
MGRGFAGGLGVWGAAVLRPYMCEAEGSVGGGGGGLALTAVGFGVCGGG